MPDSKPEYNVNDLNKLTDSAILASSVSEVVDKDGNNYQVDFATVVQVVANNLPGANSLKSGIKIVKCYDTTDPQYYYNNSTLTGLDPNTLCLGTLCYVQFPGTNPPTWYQLQPDAQGNVGPVSYDGSFDSQKYLAKWEAVNSLEARAATIKDFTPFEASYAKDAQVKRVINGALRLFVARQDLEQVDGRIPTPQGTSSDLNWQEFNLDSTITTGELFTRFKAGDGIRFSLTDDGRIEISTVLAALPAPPAAPTAGQVDDTADTFSFVPNPAYPAFSQYKVAGLPGVVGAVTLDATNSYVGGNRIYIKVIGPVAVRGLVVYVAGSGNVPDGAPLLNLEAFTGPVASPEGILNFSVQGDDALINFAVTSI